MKRAPIAAALFGLVTSACGNPPAEVVTQQKPVARATAAAQPDWRLTPWIEPQDTSMSLFASDEYAWRLFVALNWPASSTGCGPDTNRRLGADGETVWERWAVKTNVYLAKAAEPKPWADQCRPAPTKVLTPTAQVEAARSELPEVMKPQFVQPEGDVSNANDEEVRMNEATFEFIRSNQLYNLDVQQKMARSGMLSIDFPKNAKEIKAHWVVLKDQKDYVRYHTAKGPDGTVYGLVALHITTKDLPRWFWATFEHVDNEERWVKEYPANFAGWVIPPVDAYACPSSPKTCREAPKGIGLENTKWQFYRLKATQTDWVDSLGEPTRVVNSKIEGAFIQTKSSCISCHALAMIGEQGRTMPFRIVEPPPDQSGRVANFVGVMDSSRRRPQSGIDPKWKFMQLDFVWSLRNATRP